MTKACKENIKRLNKMKINFVNKQLVLKIYQYIHKKIS